MYITSILGSGAHGHIFMMITTADFLTQTVIVYVAQVSPLVIPVHKSNATGPQISETIRQWTEDHRTFNITQEVGQ